MGNSSDSKKAQKEQDMLLQEQINADKAELEAKKQAVFQERLNIINSSRGQIWSPSGTYMPNKPTNSGNQPKLHKSSELGRRS